MNCYGTKKTLYLVLDTETATLPFADEITRNAQEKQKIAISKPLVYDIGWTIIDRDCNEYERKSFLIAETFAVPAVFNTAYYKEKRPIYLERLRNDETTLTTWQAATETLVQDMVRVNFLCAYNAMFDFKKAIPFTELYVNKVYSPNYQAWEKMQREHCARILTSAKAPNDREFNGMTFTFRGIDYALIDIWGAACTNLINNRAYKKFCLDNKRVTASGKFFQTSAEAVFAYSMREKDFSESHTAIDDSLIEGRILSKSLSRGSVPKGITYFPFEILGTTFDYLRDELTAKREHYHTIISILENKMEDYDECSPYRKTMEQQLNFVRALYGERFN